MIGANATGLAEAEKRRMYTPAACDVQDLLDDHARAMSIWLAAMDSGPETIIRLIHVRAAIVRHFASEILRSIEVR